MSTDTREYETRAERKLAKKVTRHPLYQKMRKRALTAEAEAAKSRKEIHELKNTVEALKQERAKLDGSLEAEAAKLQEASS